MKQGTSSRMDMVNGPIWGKLPRYALPVAATAILGQLFNAADIAVVGNFTGQLRTLAVAAVGANSPIVSLVVTLFVGISLGANVVIAHAVGQGDAEAAGKAAHTTIVMALLGGILAAVVGQLVAVPLLTLLQVPQEVFPLALSYLRIYFAGLPVILLYNFEAAIFRSVGQTRLPLVTLALSGVLNVVLNLVFVLVFHRTVDGVALATVLSNAVSALVLYGMLRRSEESVRIHPKNLTIDPESFRQILRIGLPAGIQSAVFSVSNVIIQGAINSLGTVIMAASSAALNLESITYNLLSAYSQACTTFVGQNCGAGKPERCRRTWLMCLAQGALVLLVAIVLVVPNGKALLSLFNSDPAVVEAGYIRVVVLMLSHLFSLVYEVTSGYLRGYGISLIPAVLTMLGVCGVRVGWILWVFPRYPSFSCIMAAFPLSLATTAVLMLLALGYYKHTGKLKTKAAGTV